MAKEGARLTFPNEQCEHGLHTLFAGGLLAWVLLHQKFQEERLRLLPVERNPYDPLCRLTMIARLQYLLRKVHGVHSDYYLESLFSHHYQFHEVVIWRGDQVFKEMAPEIQRKLDRLAEEEARQLALQNAGRLRLVAKDTVSNLLFERFSKDLSDADFDQLVWDQRQIMMGFRDH